MNQVVEVLENRRTIRKYSDRPIPDDIRDSIIRCAQRAPSGCNFQHYSIINITDKDLQKKLQKNCKNIQTYISKAPMMLIFCADLQKHQDYWELNDVPKICKEKGVAFNSPDACSMFFTMMDAVLAAHTAVIAAESYGIGSCYIGHIVSHIEDNRKLLNLPKYVFPVIAVLFGYPPEGVHGYQGPRFDRKYMVFDNKYRRLSKDELDDMFSVRFNNPQPNRFGAENAAQFSYLNRYSGTGVYNEMSRSFNEIMKTWLSEDNEDQMEN